MLRTLFTVFCLLSAGARAQANPAVRVDLASRTAWTFRSEGEARGRSLPVPAGGWRLNGFPGVTAGTYERRIVVPKLPGSAGQTTYIAFEAVNWEAVVSVGPDAAHLREVGRHLSPWTPFRIDISRVTVPGKSALLRVAVRDRTHFQDAAGRFTVPAGDAGNDRQARGIIRGVALEVTPDVAIDDVFVRPSTPTDSLSYAVTLVNASRRRRTVQAAARLSAWNPGAKWNYPPLPPVKVTLAPGERKTVSIGPVRWTPGRASWWWPNIPFRPDYHAQLHRLTLTLRDAERANTIPLQTETVRFGFCTPGQKGNTYTLNGTRINLRGDSLPEDAIGTDAFARLPGFLAPTKTGGGWPDAVRDYQQMNLNVIRFHDIPATRTMMDVCDEFGLLVIPETAIDGHAKLPDIAKLPEAFTTHLRELIRRDRNHPCVFKWSLQSEVSGVPESFLRTLYQTCMEADGTRPCSMDTNDALPNWPLFAAIAHDSQPPGTPDAAGGPARADRPFGQGAFVRPASGTPSGRLWFSLMTRSLRVHDNADIRPYAWIDVWPGIIPGLTPANFPDPASPNRAPNPSESQVLDPVNPWPDPRIQFLQRSFAPVAAYDRAVDIAMTPSNSHGDWPAFLPQLPASKTTTRQLVVFNDEFAGDRLQVRLEPTLVIDAKKRQSLAPIQREAAVPSGEHASVTLELPVPKVSVNTLLIVDVVVRKDGKERFREPLGFVAVPAGSAGTQAHFEGRDDTTQGNWIGAYGKEGFLVAIPSGASHFQSEAASLRRGTGFNAVERADPKFFEPDESDAQDKVYTLNPLPPASDTRFLQQGPGLPNRAPALFYTEGTPMFLRVDTTDGKPHRLSLYLLDPQRAGQSADVDVYDLQGHRLDSRHIGDYGKGTYLRYQFTGNLIVRLTRPDGSDPTLSGLFVDASSGDSLAR